MSANQSGGWYLSYEFKKKCMEKRVVYIIGSIFGVLILAVPAFAQYGLQETAGAAGLTKYGGSVPVLVGNVIGAGLSMVSVIFFALMIYGGIRYMIARGNEEDTKKAINTIWAAVIGILIVLASYAITQFVFSSLGTGAGGTTPTGTTGLPAGVTGGWCLVDGECVQGGGSPCPGQFFNSQQECTAAGGTVSGGTEDSFTCDATSAVGCENQAEGTACTVVGGAPGTCIKTGQVGDNACSCEVN